MSPGSAPRRDRRPASTRRSRTTVLLGVLVALGPLLAGPSLAGAARAASAPGAALPAAAKPIPSKGQVAAARRAAAAAAVRVTQVQAAYQAASVTLVALQGEVSAAAEAYGQAASELGVRTATADAARVDAEGSQRVADAADLVVRQDASLAYQEGGSFGTIGALLRADGPQDLVDITTVLDAIGARRSGDLERSAAASQLAAGQHAAARRAQQEQQQAADVAKAALAVAQTKVQAAAAQAAEVQRQQQAQVAELARLQKVSVTVATARQEGLAELARERAAAAARARAAAAARAAATARAEASARAGQRSAVYHAFSSGGSPAQTRSQLDPQAVARGMMGSYGFGGSQWSCLVDLWNGESGWTWSATNPSSGAYGIPQALPGYKMASAGGDWLTDPVTQIRWGLGYISSAYGSPCSAWAAWQSRSPHWY